jgi:hypothetical protein
MYIFIFNYPNLTGSRPANSYLFNEKLYLGNYLLSALLVIPVDNCEQLREIAAESGVQFFG